MSYSHVDKEAFKLPYVGNSANPEAVNDPLDTINRWLNDYKAVGSQFQAKKAVGQRFVVFLESTFFQVGVRIDTKGVRALFNNITGHNEKSI